MDDFYVLPVSEQKYVTNYAHCVSRKVEAAYLILCREYHIMGTRHLEPVGWLEAYRMFREIDEMEGVTFRQNLPPDLSIGGLLIDYALEQMSRRIPPRLIQRAESFYLTHAGHTGGMIALSYPGMLQEVSAHLRSDFVVSIFESFGAGIYPVHLGRGRITELSSRHVAALKEKYGTADPRFLQQEERLYLFRPDRVGLIPM